MLDTLKGFLISVLDKLGFLSEDQKLSITNLSVIVFITITAFRMLFGGMTITHGQFFNWEVQVIDVSSTLPLLFSLLNYSHKRVELNKSIIGKESNESQENSSKI